MTHTIASLQDKSPEELNYLCEQALGFEPSLDYHNRASLYFGVVKGTNGWRQARPYATSYDATMLELKKLSDKQSFTFIEHLRVIRNIEATGDFAFTWLILTASPADLTRALILALTQ